MQDVEWITEQNQERVRFAREMDREMRRRNYLEIKREKELRRQEVEQKIRRGVTMTVWAMVGAGSGLGLAAAALQNWDMLTSAAIWFALAGVVALFASEGQ